MRRRGQLRYQHSGRTISPRPSSPRRKVTSLRPVPATRPVNSGAVQRENPTTGSQWSMGPTVVAMRQDGPWTSTVRCGTEVWSFSGDPSRADVNQMFLQPFLAYQATPHDHADGPVGDVPPTGKPTSSSGRCRSISSCRSWRRSGRSRQVTRSASARSWRIPTSDRRGRLRGLITLLLPKTRK